MLMAGTRINVEKGGLTLQLTRYVSIKLRLFYDRTLFFYSDGGKNNKYARGTSKLALLSN